MSRAFTASSVALAVALLSANGWAQTPQPPKVVPEAPAMGGEPQTKSGPAVIALRANEVQLSHVADASLMRTTTEKLGQLSRPLYGNQANTNAQVPEKVGTLTVVADKNAGDDGQRQPERDLAYGEMKRHAHDGLACSISVSDSRRATG
jgi:hypothetical protein